MAIKVSKEDRRALDAILAEINDPATSDERRAELREEYSGIAEGYVAAEIFGDDLEGFGE